jgi:hypothetical protein
MTPHDLLGDIHEELEAGDDVAGLLPSLAHLGATRSVLVSQLTGDTTQY